MTELAPNDIVYWLLQNDVLIKARIKYFRKNGDITVVSLFAVSEHTGEIICYLGRSYDVPANCVKWLRVGRSPPTAPDIKSGTITPGASPAIGAEWGTIYVHA